MGYLKNLKILYTLAVVFLTVSLYGQNKKVYNAERVASHIKIDGNFDDQAWQSGDWEGDFVQFEPDEGKEPSQETFFKIKYDDDNIYVAMKCLDNEIDKIENRLSRRDEWEGDICGVNFDSYFDKRTSFVFAVSAAGVKNDGFFSNDGDNFDDSWDPVWNVKTKMTAEGWNAEMQIPLSQLRFNSNNEQVWGLEVVRNIFRTEEFSLWSPISKKNPGWVSQYGEIHGIKNIKPKKQVELAPFVVSKFDKYEKEAGNPFADGRDYNFNGGIDGKIGLTNDLILDFAINPDFGQVEADPSEVNLTAFETFYQEKRPFFIEGNNITSFQLTPGGSPWASDNLFYSRRIGKQPSFYPDIEDGEFLKIPENTRILGAVKLTGKTKKGWSIGIIESMTNKENAIIDHEGQRRKVEVEPFTNYFVSRLQKDINKGNTIIGAMFTSTNRFFNNNNLNFIPKNAISGGLDFRQYFKNKQYFILANIAASRVSGSAESIDNLQTSSRRYYQRPDADYLHYDNTKTELYGVGGSVMAGKETNHGLRYGFFTTFRSPGLELNDVGYLREANSIMQVSWTGYKINNPFYIFRSFDASIAQWAGWDFGGNNLFKGGNIEFNVQLKNLWKFGIGFNLNGQNLSNTALRGGPAVKVPGGYEFWSFISSNEKKKLKVNLSYALNNGKYDSQNTSRLSANLTYKPINTLRLSLSPSIRFNKTEFQYTTEIDFNEAPRYIFGGLDQTTFNLVARIDVNLTPDLSLQYYGSPFISSVNYIDFKRITNPKADNYYDRYHLFSGNEINYDNIGMMYNIDETGDGIYDYSFSNPSFNFKEFNSNLILRWEYTPGSSIYLVWSQGRNEYEECNCGFEFKQNIKDLFKISPRDVFLLKVSYRIRGEKLF